MSTFSTLGPGSAGSNPVSRPNSNKKKSSDSDVHDDIQERKSSSNLAKEKVNKQQDKDDSLVEALAIALEKLEKKKSTARKPTAAPSLLSGLATSIGTRTTAQESASEYEEDDDDSQDDQDDEYGMVRTRCCCRSYCTWCIKTSS